MPLVVKQRDYAPQRRDRRRECVTTPGKHPIRRRPTGTTSRSSRTNAVASTGIKHEQLAPRSPRPRRLSTSTVRAPHDHEPPLPPSRVTHHDPTSQQLAGDEEEDDHTSSVSRATSTASTSIRPLSAGNEWLASCRRLPILLSVPFSPPASEKGGFSRCRPWRHNGSPDFSSTVVLQVA